MKKSFDVPSLGTVVVKESVWTGKFTVLVNGVEAKRMSKTAFLYEAGASTYDINITGNFVKGSTMTINGDSYKISENIKWYEYVLALLPFVFILIWGNVPALCQILPVVGGALGGVVSALMGILSAMVMKETKSVALKILYGIAFFLATIAICYALAIIYLTLVNA